MAARKNCKHQGFTYAKNRYKNVHIICDLDGETHKKEYCRKCKNYDPRKPQNGKGDAE